MADTTAVAFALSRVVLGLDPQQAAAGVSLPGIEPTDQHG